MSLINKIFTFDNILSAEELSQYQKYAKTLNISKPSFVFHRGEQQFKHNEEVRKSKTTHVEDQDLLEFVKSGLLKTVSQKSGMNIKLARKSVTFIKYEEGGFFDWHNDHEKYVINGRSTHLEMHLLFCIGGTQKGGELLIKKTKNADPTKIKQACTTNGCVVFDKHLDHAGGKVVQGTKLIMTVDVMVSTKAQALNPTLSLRMEDLTEKLAAGKINNIGTYRPKDLKLIWNLIPKNQRSGLIPFVEVDYSGMTQMFGPKVGRYGAGELFYLNDEGEYLTEKYPDEDDEYYVLCPGNGNPNDESEISEYTDGSENGFDVDMDVLK